MSEPWADPPPSVPGYYWCSTPSWGEGEPRLLLFEANEYTGNLHADRGGYGPDDVMFRRGRWTGPIDLKPPAKPR